MLITTNKSVYNPGEKIEGQIFLLLDEAFPGNNLVLKIMATEISKWYVYPGKKIKNSLEKHHDVNFKLMENRNIVLE